ncbi:unnamed protein product [Auanema sp. JU1783]|nr:unnamed protein product [Auanema sp. JU1783]
MTKTIISILLLASTASAALLCSNGGNGPCVIGSCLTAGEVCDSNGENCCAISQLIDDTVVTTTTVATTVADATATTVAGVTTTVSATTVSSATTAACVDLRNPTTGVSDCPARASLCNDTTYYDIMTVQCPRTCNRCSSVSTTVSTGCVDAINPRTGVSDCPQRTGLCTDSNYIALMRVQCPRTCGFCGSTTVGTATTATTTCVDKTAANGTSDCARRANLCRNAAYITLMRDQCPRTCGFC